VYPELLLFLTQGKFSTFLGTSIIYWINYSGPALRIVPQLHAYSRKGSIKSFCSYVLPITPDKAGL